MERAVCRRTVLHWRGRFVSIGRFAIGRYWRGRFESIRAIWGGRYESIGRSGEGGLP